jgi:hypothetical protein
MASERMVTILLRLARTHLQQLLKATAVNVAQVLAWPRGEPLGDLTNRVGRGQVCQFGTVSIPSETVK